MMVKGRATYAILTAADVREIRSLYQSGVISQHKLAARFGVTQTTINRAILRKNWTHVE
jgi:hypothetical protein